MPGLQFRENHGSIQMIVDIVSDRLSLFLDGERRHFDEVEPLGIGLYCFVSRDFQLAGAGKELCSPSRAARPPGFDSSR